MRGCQCPTNQQWDHPQRRSRRDGVGQKVEDFRTEQLFQRAANAADVRRARICSCVGGCKRTPTSALHSNPSLPCHASPNTLPDEKNMLLTRTPLFRPSSIRSFAPLFRQPLNTTARISSIRFYTATMSAPNVFFDIEYTSPAGQSTSSSS